MARQRISYADIRTDSLYRDVDRLLDELTPGQLRQAYTAARSVLQKRVVRIEQAGLESPVVESFRSSVPTLATIAEHTQKAKTDKFIARQLVRVLNILDQPTASVKELKSINARTASTLNTLLGLNESGSMLSTGNLKEFGHFMEYARSIRLALLYDSRDIAQPIADYIADTPGDQRTLKSTWRWTRKQGNAKRLWSGSSGEAGPLISGSVCGSSRRRFSRRPIMTRSPRWQRGSADL